MSILKALGLAPHNAEPSILLFQNIDVGAVARRLRINERAMEQANAGLPASDSTGLDAVELEIVNEIGHELKTQHDDYLENQKAYLDRINDLEIQSVAQRVSGIAENAITDFKTALQTGVNELYPRRRELQDTERDLARFRKEHGLSRPPTRYGPKTMKIGLLLILLAIEAVLNGSFLAKGNILGLAGGVLEALFIAGMNVVVGVLFGRMILPYLVHRNWGAKLFALLGLLIFIAFLLGFNLGVAHYRSAVVNDPFEASLHAYRSLMADPVGLADLQGWALFLVGALFSVIAAIDGWLMDDSYPGYGAKMRHNKQTIEAYTAMKSELLQMLKDRKKQAETDLDEMAKNLQAHYRTLVSLVQRGITLTAKMRQHVRHLEDVGNALLAQYRDANRMNRNTPPPKRFDISWQLPEPEYAQPLDQIVDTSKFEGSVEHALENMGGLRSNLHAAYLDGMAEYRRIDDLVDEGKA